MDAVQLAADAGLLDRLEVDPVDRATIAGWAAALTPDDHDRIDELIRRLRSGIGDWFGVNDRKVLAGGDGIDDRLAPGVLPLFALLATAPDVHAAHLARGLDEATSWHTLADLGQQLRVCRRVHGHSNLATAWWLANAWSDGFVRLGRLQFELTRSPDATPVIGVHIPDTGPLAPDAVDAAFAAAPGHFARHYPEVQPQPHWFECDSWLLSPQLQQLVPGSNMAAFQARWSIVELGESDRSGLFFGFGIEPNTPNFAADTAFLDTLPTHTRLHRGMVELWRAGGHFQAPRGRIAISASGR